MRHIVVIGASLGALACHFFMVEEWRWPSIGAFLFVAIIVAMRGVAEAIGKGLEKKFNGEK